MSESSTTTMPLPLPQALEGQLVLLIGSGSGINFAAARLLINTGVHVMLVACDAQHTFRHEQQ